MLIASKQLLFFKRLLSSDNVIIQALLTSVIGHDGITANAHFAIRQDYDLMNLNLLSASHASIMNVFTSRLKRIACHRNQNDIDQLGLLG